MSGITISKYDTYQVACNDHLVFGELNILRDSETLEQPLSLFLGLQLLFPVISNVYF